MRAFLRKYWLEVIVLFGLVIGVFLLIEKVNILEIGAGIIAGAWTVIRSATAILFLGVAGFFKQLELSEFIGLVLVLGGGFLLAWRARQRFMVSGRYRGRSCPRCGGWFLRVRRTRLDRILGGVLFLRLFRYRCSNPECGWEGLRKPGRRQEQFNVAER